ncbi:unnamed protein product [Staurois parvus]|uniref:Uncharacterized protein n=1 Tax=Staurois parvus TaxID=386267 RepID=A0ABN9AS33_9NEOB|nr:unnamed protein product [Staurois parvus]
MSPPHSPISLCTTGAYTLMSPSPTVHQSLYRGAYTLMSPPPQSHQSLYRGAYTLMSPPPHPISLCTEELTL